MPATRTWKTFGEGLDALHCLKAQMEAEGFVFKPCRHADAPARHMAYDVTRPDGSEVCVACGRIGEARVPPCGCGTRLVRLYDLRMGTTYLGHPTCGVRLDEKLMKEKKDGDKV